MVPSLWVLIIIVTICGSTALSIGDHNSDCTISKP